jgi:penicillin amidase
LANDPHLTASAPSLWYLAELSAPGLHVTGASLPGQPGIFIGHNERIAWGVTNLGADVQDLYAETFSGERPLRYRRGGAWREATVRREVIRVRKEPSSDENELHTVEVVATDHGPIVYDGDDTRYALRWTELDGDAHSIETLVPRLDRAGDWATFRAALAAYEGVPLNFVYADVDGHIGFASAGHIPLRAGGGGELPFADEGAGAWRGFVPAAELPQLFDPPDGMIVSANNRIVGRDYPYYLTSDWNPPYRAHRIHQLLDETPHPLTAADFRRIQGDTYSIPDAIFARAVAKMASAHATEAPEWRALQAALAGWDGRARADSRTLPLVVTMRSDLGERLLTGALGEDRAKLVWAADHLIDQIITTQPRAWLPAGYRSYAQLVLESYRAALADLEERLGPDRNNWEWGKSGLMHFPHPLADSPDGKPFAIAPLPLASGGSVATVDAGDGVSLRFIADTSAWDASQLCIPLGESGDPSSVHWRDQLDEWRKVEPEPLPFSRAAVAAAAPHTQRLVPAPEVAP